MGRQISKVASVFICILVSGLLSHAFEDQKTYYSPDPHTGTPPTGTHNTPPRTPSHGTPPVVGNCGPPPSTGHGGGPTTPSTPPSGGGGYYHSPPSSGTPPVTITPPTTPIVIPGTPSIPASPPFVIDPNSPFTGTCNYWRTHPTIVWGLVGWWGTLGGAFGGTSFPGATPTLSLPDALSNTHTDAYSSLYREGTAALLNAMVNHRFPYTTSHVRDSFVTSLGSSKAAATQARLFKMANEGRLKPRA